MSTTSANTEHEGRSPASENVPAPQGASLVLHIRPDPLGAMPADGSTTQVSEAASVDALLESASLRVAACPDVYRGLARLLSAGPETPVAVIVCVDELSPGEMEFFSIVAGRRQASLVYVYGLPRCESKLTQAVGLGAAGRVTEEVIRRLAAVDTPPSVPATRDQPPQESVAGDRPVTDETVPSDQPSELGPEAQPDDSEQAVRVPWLRYTDRPARTGPGNQPPPSAEDPAEPGPEVPTRTSPEPLLTDEELRALIGEDDIAALAPEQPDPLWPDKPSGEGRDS